MSRKTTRKTSKVCPVCGGEFLGTGGKMTCSNACRAALYRILKSNKRPPFMDEAKNNDQKIPGTPAQISPQEKWIFNAEIDRQISEEKARRSRFGVHPKVFKTEQDRIIQELENKKLK